MKRVSVTELKNQLSKYLRMVKRGETIVVVERSVPIARLTAETGAAAAEAHDLQRLLREGIVTRRASGRVKLPPLVPCSGDAARAVIDGRGDR